MVTTTRVPAASTAMDAGSAASASISGHPAAAAGRAARASSNRARERPADPARIDPALYPRLFCYVTTAAAAADCPNGPPPMNGACDAGACRGNGNGGHLYGTALSPDQKRALIEHLKTF